MKSKQSRYPFLMLIGVCFLYAGGLGGVLDAAGVFFVPVCKELGLSRGEIALYLSTYLATSVFVTPFVGRILPRCNIRIVMSVAFIFTALAVAMMGTYTEAWQWWVSGVIFGIAGSFIFIIPGPILITNWFSEKTGMFQGIAAACSGLGAALLSPVYTAIIEAVGWRTAYPIMALIICAMVLPWTILVFRFKPADIGLKPYGYKPERDADLNGELKEPGVPFKKGILSISFICVFLFAGLISYFSGFNSHLPGFAESIGYSAMFGASMVSAASLGSVAEKLIIGYLNDKIGVKVTAFIEVAMVALGFIGFLVFDGKAALICAAIFFGTQSSLISVSVPQIVKTIFGTKDYSMMFSMARVGTGAIGCFGPATIGFLFDHFGSFAPSFFLGIGICITAAILLNFGFFKSKKLAWED